MGYSAYHLGLLIFKEFYFFSPNTLNSESTSYSSSQPNVLFRVFLVLYFLGWVRKLCQLVYKTFMNLKSFGECELKWHYLQLHVWWLTAGLAFLSCWFLPRCRLLPIRSQMKFGNYIWVLCFFLEIVLTARPETNASCVLISKVNP